MCLCRMVSVGGRTATTIILTTFLPSVFSVLLYCHFIPEAFGEAIFSMIRRRSERGSQPFVSISLAIFFFFFAGHSAPRKWWACPACMPDYHYVS
ncbi:hypothetical protein F5Y10DRAFT_99460 [Nemania abortiva]|nr:hypothetical protein F5Y10DRAFT_99460 [Nemania abortiva]